MTDIPPRYLWHSTATWCEMHLSRMCEGAHRSEQKAHDLES